MLSRLFPKQIDNLYRGHVLAIWLLVPVVLVKFLMGLNVAGFNPWIGSREILATADGVQLDAFDPYAASLLIYMFASWGLGILLFSLIGVLVLVRYRAMIPLMFLLLTIEQIGRRGLVILHPVLDTGARADGAPPGVLVNWALTAALMLGLVLSLVVSRRGESTMRPAQRKAQ